MVDNSKLFEKYKLNNNVEVPSRLAVAPMVIFGADDTGHITDEERAYLAHRATGIGLYILGASAVPRVISSRDLVVTIPCPV